MIFEEQLLKGIFLIRLAPFKDDRGTFARIFCQKEFSKHNLNTNFVQTNIAYSERKFTLRGLHYQTDGSEEDKLIKCIKGRILDVAIDLREKSSTYGKFLSIELSEKEDIMIYVPRGFAHGYITLEDGSEIIYQVTNFYDKLKEKGIRWNDPYFNIKWPTNNPILSEKDKNFGDFKP